MTSCQKENSIISTLETSKEQTPIQALDNVVDSCFPTWSFSRYNYDGTPCVIPDFTLCVATFLPFPTGNPGTNEASGTAYVNEEENLILDFGQVNLDNQTLVDMISTQVFTVEDAVEFPNEMISPLFVEAGYQPLDQPFIMQSGNYNVTFEGEVPSTQAAVNPRKIIYKYRRNGTLRKVIVKY